uniref:Uncharacterized protein n=1 Tax=Arundo donax TaxID=35708 RepID=A0A0A9E837_ARUDO
MSDPILETTNSSSITMTSLFLGHHNDLSRVVYTVCFVGENIIAFEGFSAISGL